MLCCGHRATARPKLPRAVEIGVDFRGAGPGAADALACGGTAARVEALRGARARDALRRSTRSAGSYAPISNEAMLHGAHGVALRRGAWDQRVRKCRTRAPGHPAPSDPRPPARDRTPDAQAPRSINLQRSEQNGRKRFSVVHSTAFAHCGQGTLRRRGVAAPYSVATIGRCPAPARVPGDDAVRRVRFRRQPDGGN